MNTSDRRYVIIGIVSLITLVFIIRLFVLQVADDHWKIKAADLTERKLRKYPSRGLIFDRNNELLVANQAIFDLLVIPREVKNIDTLAFCELVGIDKAEFDTKLKAARKYASYKSSVFLKQIAPENYATISEQLYKYPGFYGQPRTVRSYENGIGALLLGDIGEVGPEEIKSDSYYKSGDYIGKGGVEMVYEKALRGEKGSQYVLVDVLNKVQESYASGQYDTTAVSGKDLISTIDAMLQAYGEALMLNKKGSIVAIEPSTGEVLALISSPTYDPNLLVGRKRGENYNKLRTDSQLPLYNRAVKGTYRPGSIFKLVQSLIALDEGAITPETRISCNRGIIGCHGAHSNDDLKGAIIHSCNPYFHQVMKRMVQANNGQSIFKSSGIGLERWSGRVQQFGFGTNLGTDIPGVVVGNVPDKGYFDRKYGEGRWAYSTIYSLAIGEGEMLTNPLQMANLAVIIANKGYYYSPHIVKSINKEGKPEIFKVKHDCGVDPKHFDLVIDAMQHVVDQTGGTARRARIPGIEVCGKTGTVQNDPLPDHSVFIAFAPKTNPKIAISVYVESAGFGGTWAAPIAALMIEKYLTDSIQDPLKEKRIMDQAFPEPLPN
jgi:penicillin-binding protein 2